MENEYYLQPPHQQMFYRIQIFLLTTFGVGRNEYWDIRFKSGIEGMSRFHGNLTFRCSFLCLLSMIVYIIDNYSESSFATLGTIFSILPVGLIAVVKLTSAHFKSYKKMMRDFMSKIHIHGYYIKDRDDFVKAKLIQTEKYTRLTTYYLVFLLGIGWCSWMVVPMVNNYLKRELVQNGTAKLQTCIYFWAPFDYSNDYRNWAVMHVFSSYICGSGCFVIAAFDSVMFAFQFNMIGHIKILKYHIKTKFPVKKISDEDDKNKLTEIIKYHAFLVNTFNDMQSAFGINVSANYLQNLFEDSLLLYELVFGEKGDKVTFGIMVLIYMGELVHMSFMLEEIRRQSEDLPDLLYCIPWEDMSLSNQKTFKLMLLKFQPILSFKAAGGLEAGVNPMLSIIKSTFTYYVMLKSSVQSSS